MQKKKSYTHKFGEPTSISVRSMPYHRMKMIIGLQPHLSICQVVSELMQKWCDENESKFGNMTLKDLLKKRA